MLHFIIYFLACASAYRASAFIHEIVHQRHNKNLSTDFVMFWHFTAGALCLTPASCFNRHLSHHKVGVFGTKADKQYYLIRENGNWVWWRCLLLFIVFPVLVPIINLVRVITHPVGMLFPEYRKFLLSINDRYYWEDDEWKLIEFVDCYYFIVYWTMLIWTIGHLNLLYNWYFVSVGAWFLSSLRVPLEHKLEYHLETSTRQDQIKDSYDFKRSWRKPIKSFISFVIQPLGLNLHRTHHTYPGLPYYLLPKYARKPLSF